MKTPVENFIDDILSVKDLRTCIINSPFDNNIPTRYVSPWEIDPPKPYRDRLAEQKLKEQYEDLFKQGLAKPAAPTTHTLVTYEGEYAYLVEIPGAVRDALKVDVSIQPRLITCKFAKKSEAIRDRNENRKNPYSIKISNIPKDFNLRRTRIVSYTDGILEIRAPRIAAESDVVTLTL
jgi:HSP20 family molecular chaperone IbpA